MVRYAGIEAYTQEVCALSGALFTALLIVRGVRWAPCSRVIAACGMLDFDDFSSKLLSETTKC